MKKRNMDAAFLAFFNAPAIPPDTILFARKDRPKLEKIFGKLKNVRLVDGRGVMAVGK